nr:MAG TPA: Protein of unknown function (DUF2621) [Caudoviricetes sp.]
MSSIFVWAFFMPLLYSIGGCHSVNQHCPDG